MKLKITKHAIDQVKFRTDKKKEKKAYFFLKWIFKELYYNKEYKWRKVQIKHSYKWTMIITDWHHKLVYDKKDDIFTIITYAVVDEYCNKIEWMFYNIFKK